MARSHLEGARAAVLARLWGALAREPIPALGPRHRTGPDLVVGLPGGREVRGPAEFAAAFAAPPAGLHLSVDDRAYRDPAALLRALRLPYPVENLAVELDNSVANLALARAAQPEPGGGMPALVRASAEPDPLAYLEQCVVDGHPLHPCCRTRIGLSPAEVLAYAPEHRPVVTLVEVAVAQRRWLGVNCPPALLMHPWQREHAPQGYGLSPTGRSIPARPLMSLRTLALVHDPSQHVKTAVDVQMTSAVRTVSVAAIHNGPTVSAMLGGLRERTGLDVFAETAAGAVLVDGEPSRSLAVIHRRASVPPAGEVLLPLAALCEPSPADGRPLAVEVVRRGYAGDPLAFVAALAGLTLPPLLTVLRLGIALEAHGQNLLVRVRGGRLSGLAYRDMGGVRISPVRLHRHGIAVPPLHGDVSCDEPDALRTKLFAAAISTGLAQLVTVLGRACALDEGAAWERIAAVARAVRAGLSRADRGDIDALFAPALPVKAMTAMRLAADPLRDLWAHQPNPLAGLGGRSRERTVVR